MTWISVISGLASAVLPTATTEGLKKNILVDLFGRVRLAAETIATGSIRTEEIVPWNTKEYGTVLADALDLLQATTDDYYIPMQFLRGHSLQFIPDPAGGTPDGETELRIGAANREDGTVPASLEYTYTTTDWFDSEAITAEDFLLFDTKMCAYYVHIEVSRGAGVGTEAYSLFLRRNV